MSNKTILFADDSVTMRTIMEKTFLAEPYDVTVVPSGEAAIMKAREISPDIIIADAGMAGVSGYDLCKAVRDDSSLSGTPFIIMAGVSHPYDESRGKEAGVDEYIKKPFDTTQLIEKVGELSKKPSAPKAPEVPAPKSTEARPPVPMPSSSRPLTEKPAVAPAGPRPIATPIAAKVPERAAPKIEPKPEPEIIEAPETPAEPVVEAAPSFEEVAQEVPEAEPIELNQEADASSFQVSTLAELAQMDEHGGVIKHEDREDAIELPEKPLVSTATDEAEPLADSLEPPTEPSGTSEIPNAIQSIRDKTDAAVKSMEGKLQGLSEEQVKAVSGLATEVIERVVWEVVPDLAETIIKEEIAKLLKE